MISDQNSDSWEDDDDILDISAQPADHDISAPEITNNLTHETVTLQISDIKARNSSANFHVRHSLIAVLTM